jgi:hypothetical protein
VCRGELLGAGAALARSLEARRSDKKALTVSAGF